MSEIETAAVELCAALDAVYAARRAKDSQVQPYLWVEDKDRFWWVTE